MYSLWHFTIFYLGIRISWDVNRNISLFFTGFLEMIFLKCARMRESLSGILYFSETSLKIKNGDIMGK